MLSLLVAFFWLFFSSFNSVYAQNTTNPLTGSQYSDIADLTDWYIAQGGSIDEYFYSEGFSTGSDGQLGNEYICIRDDVNKVYVGRSDVCADRQMDGDGYSYIWVDRQDWSNGFPENILLQTGDVIGDSSINWSGCFNVYPNGTEIWAGTSGGQCPNMIESGQINYGYVQQTLTNTAAINLALQEAGVEVTGYRYEWNVKNADANMESENNPDSIDPFEVTIKIYDETGKPVFEKTYDYSFWIDSWTTFSGTETFTNPFDADTLSEIQLSITGYDIGYWAGYYGPEFSSPEINLQYRMKAVPMEDPIAELLFQQKCDLDPLSDIMCPNYQTAMLEQINNTKVSSLATEDPVVKEIVIIESTGSIPLSENELAVLDSLEETQEQVVETEQEKPAVDNSAALAVAENAVSSALSEAASVVDNTLAATAQSVTDAQTIANDLEENRQDVQAALDNDMQTSLSTIEQSLESTSTTQITTFDNTQSQTQMQSQNNPSTNGQMTADNSSNDNFGNDGGMDNTGNIDLTSSFENSTQINTNGDDNSSNDGTFDDNLLNDNTIAIETTIETPKIDILDLVINEAINNVLKAEQEIVEESIEESEEDIEKQNAKEDELVEQALSGDDSEDAQSALLGYNPQFRAYQTPQMDDGQFYQPKEIYGGQKNYDNPSQRFFNGASDAKHKEMVRLQYK